MDEVRTASVAGKFYPLDPGELESNVRSLLESAETKNLDGKVKALLVPHSGYQFCGDVLGAGYRTISGQAVDEVFILSSPILHKSERVAFSNFKCWEIPTGKLEQSHRVRQIAQSDDGASKDLFVIDNTVHQGEHAIELQLPFIRHIWDESVRIIPALIGDVSPRLVARSLAKYIDAQDLLIVAAELSHGYPSDYAKEIDQTAISNVLNLRMDVVMHEGFESSARSAVGVLVELAILNRWSPELILYNAAKSGEGSMNRSSGYVAIAFVEKR